MLALAERSLQGGLQAAGSAEAAAPPVPDPAQTCLQCLQPMVEKHPGGFGGSFSCNRCSMGGASLGL